jgi:hypothetical protein
MNEIPFHRTGLGKQFFERTLPRLIKELTRLNNNLEKLCSLQGPESASMPNLADPLRPRDLPEGPSSQ